MGRGDNIRDWLYVEDHARALRLVLNNGQVGRTYNLGGNNEKTNREVVKSICAVLDRILPDSRGPYERLIQFITDRPGHDRRYAIDSSRITRELYWRPEETIESGLKKTVLWCKNNMEWVERVRTGSYREWIDINYNGWDDENSAVRP